MVKLRATQGADEANADGVLYRVNNDGTVDVPTAMVGPLTHIGGFILADTETPVSAGFVRVSRPDGAGCSWGGVSYEPDENGQLIVPAEAASDLAAHGFAPIGQTVAQVQARIAAGPHAAPPAGEALLQGEPNQGCSWNGASFTADADGLVIVPLAAVDDLRAHGFTVAVTKGPETDATEVVEPAPAEAES